MHTALNELYTECIPYPVKDLKAIAQLPLVNSDFKNGLRGWQVILGSASTIKVLNAFSRTLSSVLTRF